MEREYVLGTHDDEVERLGLQHRVWRRHVLESWNRGGLNVGQTVVDLGCGPGWATADLSEIVGGDGRVIACDRSARFLEVVRRRELRNVEVHELDLDVDALPAVQADFLWTRWVFAFVRQPREVLRKAAALVKRGGSVVIHEYFDYGTWRLSPRSEVFERFVKVVKETWRRDGGEPDIGLELPRWLQEEGFEIRSRRPLLEMITPSNLLWQWPRAFVDIGVPRMVKLGALTEEEGTQIIRALDAAENAPDAWMINPAVVEIVAVKR